MAICFWNIRPIVLLPLLILRVFFAYENIALNKPAYQQYPFTGNKSMVGSATNAVDGLKSDRSAWGGQCVVSEERKQSATWWVDLTRVSCISHIIVYYMTGNKEWGQSNEFTEEFLGFSIYVSNTTEKSEGVLCFKDSGSNKTTIRDFVDITCSVHGRYVIFYNERQKGLSYPNDYSKFAYNGLCEVEVYGLDNCSILCPDHNCHCCNNGTKACQGCKPGYQGKHCEIELDEKRDGYKKRCGYCSDLSKCNYESSTCFDKRWPDMKQNDNKQENQLTNNFERQTITLGKWRLAFLILIFVVLLILVGIFLWSRNHKKSKQQGYTAVSTEEPNNEEKNHKKSKQQGYTDVSTEETNNEENNCQTLVESNSSDNDTDENDDDSSWVSRGYVSDMENLCLAVGETETSDIDTDKNGDDCSMDRDRHGSLCLPVGEAETSDIDTDKTAEWIAIDMAGERATYNRQ